MFVDREKAKSTKARSFEKKSDEKRKKTTKNENEYSVRDDIRNGYNCNLPSTSKNEEKVLRTRDEYTM